MARTNARNKKHTCCNDPTPCYCLAFLYTGGVLKQLNPTLPTIIIKGGAHHYDLRAANPEDTSYVITARNVEKEYIKQWIKVN